MSEIPPAVNYNPDVLSCLANLSSDEVFTPPSVVNRMLDALPEALWRDKNVTFLDPVCKSGVFLREIAKRLLAGLADEIPDLQKRADHIFRHQIFGMAVTELTSLLTRRSLYCTKFANCPYSVSRLKTAEGNIRFERIGHQWQDGRCQFCGASQSEYDRDESRETYAYEFIHGVSPEEIFSMKFDVIVGNPPYQLSDGGAQSSASPIYHKFIEQAIKLNPRYLTMIVPARWYSGGKGLDEFRSLMLNDSRIKVLHDFQDSSDCFPSVVVEGGICYFLWDRLYHGDCNITNHYENGIENVTDRPLLRAGFTTFIRYNEAITILDKIQQLNELTFNTLVSARKPFGLPTNFTGRKVKEHGDIALYQHGNIGYIDKNEITRGDDLIKQYKVYISKAYGAGHGFPQQVINKPFFGDKNTCCTETYLVIGPFATKETAKNVISYITTKFFRFLVLLIKNTQDATQKVYSFVPQQDFSKSWTDEELYAKYGLTEEEVAFIESMIRPME